MCVDDVASNIRLCPLSPAARAAHDSDSDTEQTSQNIVKALLPTPTPTTRFGLETNQSPPPAVAAYPTSNNVLFANDDDDYAYVDASPLSAAWRSGGGSGGGRGSAGGSGGG